MIQFSSVQSLSHVQRFVTSWTAAHRVSLSITNSRSLLKLVCIKSVMLYNSLILCCPLLLLPSIFPSIRVFSNELVFCIRCPKYWSFSFSFSPSNTQDWFPLGLTGLIFTLSKVLSKAFSNTTVKSIMCHWKTTWLIISIYLFTPVLGIRQEHWWGNGPLSMCMFKYNLVNQMGVGNRVRSEESLL